MHKLDTEKAQSVIEQYTVGELIPHSDPMVLLDKVVEQSEQSLTAEITIREESRFYDLQEQGVPTWVAIEYMAQAIAALAGVRSKLNNEPINLGFLLGTRKFHIINQFLPADKTYQIEVEQLYMDDSGLASFDCIIRSGEEVYGKAKLNVFETDDVQAIIEKK
ncbi:ApeP family dehydratase [Aliikangiella sp. IMCC44359]|uniref:ApeP family dehydratase n=1 Tax=Aliikangiella sp. IMCC44359 TaxID=3459125 RepID=UPI00403B1981